MRLAWARLASMSSVSGPSEPGTVGTPAFHGGDRGHFVAHQADSVGFRADEDKAGALNLLSKVGVLREEAIPRVNCYRAGDLSGADDSRMFR